MPIKNFVRVIIQNEKGELLVIFEKKWNCWVFPGGKIEPGETPLQAAKREVFEETNLVVKNCQKIGEEIIFYANLPIGKQHWKGYFFQTNEYSGEIKNKGEVLDVKFVDVSSREEKEDGHSYQHYLEKIKKLKKYVK
jgi:8-oxo-dGTP pyrophosphatase MutT (NUDIX family)